MESTHNYLFVSDFHLSEGYVTHSRRLSRNEDFFHDEAFAQFLVHHVRLSQAPGAADYYRKPWRLIINGDIFDFLQVISLPAEGDELFAVRRVRSYDELSANERRYGLGTRSGEIVWKLQRIAEGHPVFFQALAWFLAHEGNELILVKGNHDIEIFWPEAQQCIRQSLVNGYQTWQQFVRQTGGLESPLVYDESLPAALREDVLLRTVQFPSSSYYVEGLLYAEHGCQYDPANAFTNFENPTLPHKPELIELPSGSLFVRYFFNEVEQTHPFADNMKPFSRYLNWVIRNAPSDATRFLVDLLPRYLMAFWRTQRKRTQDALRQVRGEARQPQLEMVQMQEGGGRRPASKRLEKAVLEIQAHSRQRLRRASKIASLATLWSIILKVISIYLILLAMRSFVLEQYLAMAAYAALGLLLTLASTLLFRYLDRLLEASYLQRASEEICRVLNDLEDEATGSVRYFIFGHDHAAISHELRPSIQLKPAHRQWYVNTGSWIPVFSETEHILRGVDQLTFLRLVPGEPGFDQSPPALLQWSIEANEPRPLRLFEEAVVQAG